jgi:hypothetical protein
LERTPAPVVDGGVVGEVEPPEPPQPDMIVVATCAPPRLGLYNTFSCNWDAEQIQITAQRRPSRQRKSSFASHVAMGGGARNLLPPPEFKELDAQVRYKPITPEQLIAQIRLALDPSAHRSTGRVQASSVCLIS